MSLEFDKLNNLMQWLPLQTRIKAVLKFPTHWIEANFHRLNIDLESIFYKKTWSLEFLEFSLPHENTDMWDHISQLYTLDEEFCSKNIDFLNFHMLYEYQNLPRSFYLKHKNKIDWIPSHIEINKENILRVGYASNRMTSL